MVISFSLKLEELNSKFTPEWVTFPKLCRSVLMESPLTLLNKSHKCEKRQKVDFAECCIHCRWCRPLITRISLTLLNIHNLFFLSFSLSLLRWTARQRNFLHSAERLWKKLLTWHRSGQNSFCHKISSKVPDLGKLRKFRKCSKHYQDMVEPNTLLINLSLKTSTQTGFFFISVQAGQVHIISSATVLLLWKVKQGVDVTQSASNCSCPAVSQRDFSKLKLHMLWC